MNALGDIIIDAQQHALLLMDNAKDAAQVQPLIPPMGCVLLVTSRLHFTLPGLHPTDLKTLPPDDAKALLLRIAPRIKDEAAAIAKLCGYLPLALELAARTLAVHVDISPAEHARKLALEKDRLKLLAEGDRSVEVSINLSYSLLDAESQKCWRMLGAFPDTFDPLAAGAVWRVEGDARLDTAKDLLSRLLQYSMLEWDRTNQRYRLHDLMRDYARKQLSAVERDESSRRHSKHFLATLAVADSLYQEGGESMLRGLGLFDAEWSNIQAGQAWAVSCANDDSEATQLCDAYPNVSIYCLVLRLHPRERIRWLEAALAAARRLKNRQSEAAHLCNLGGAYQSLDDSLRAIPLDKAALAIADELGDQRCRALTLGNLGIAYSRLGKTERGTEYFEKQLRIANEIGDKRSAGNALGSIGNNYAHMGNIHRGIEYHARALAIHRAIGDRPSECMNLGNLGTDYLRLGEFHRAIHFYEQHLKIAREIGDRHGEGIALWNMSRALDKLGDRMHAIEHAKAALKILEQIEAPDAAKVRRVLEEWKK